MTEERGPGLENVVWRLEQRQNDIRATLAEHKERLERMEKQLHDLTMKIQWLQWHAEESRDQIKTLAPLAHQVAAIDPALVRIVVGSLVTAVLGLAGGNLFFGDQ